MAGWSNRLTMSSDKPTLALARRLAREKGYEADGVFVSGYEAELRHRGRYVARVYAPTRTATLAGLIAIIRALPKRKGAGK